MPRRHPAVRVLPLVAVTAAALTLSACVGAKSVSSSPGATSTNADAKDVTLVIGANDIAGGKNAAEANWLTGYVIPTFTQMEAAKGVTAHVTFNGAGVDDEVYKTKLELGLKTGSAPDVFSADGIWLGELASAGYVKPLDDTVGERAGSWDGWGQISQAVQQNLTYQGHRYGIPAGTDGRVLYFNKTLFAQAGLPSDWQPKSWQDILDAGAALKKISGVTPIQIDAGTAMGEATTTQGFLPLLAGTGSQLYDQGSSKWQGDTSAVKDVLGFYQKIYGGGLGDPNLQQDKSGRDESFAEFSQGKIGILAESDYFWRSIICPDTTTCNTTAMPDRNSVVGFALPPAEQPGKGVNQQDYVSVSGGGGWLMAPGTKYPQQAWDLMTVMESKDAQIEFSKAQIRISARKDVNDATLTGDPLLTFISQKVLPVTVYRPSDAAYNAVSLAVQEATAAVVSGTSPSDAASQYQSALEKAVGGSDHVTGG